MFQRRVVAEIKCERSGPSRPRLGPSGFANSAFISSHCRYFFQFARCFPRCLSPGRHRVAGLPAADAHRACGTRVGGQGLKMLLRCQRHRHQILGGAGEPSPPSWPSAGRRILAATPPETQMTRWLRAEGESGYTACWHSSEILPIVGSVTVRCVTAERAANQHFCGCGLLHSPEEGLSSAMAFC